MSTVTKMRLSKETYNILKNYAAINSNILIQPGNLLKTISPGKNIYVTAKVTEDFDVEVPIWDLNKFLGIVSMFNNPDLEFYDTHVIITNGRSSVTYYYSEPSLLTVPTKEMKMPNAVTKFENQASIEGGSKLAAEDDISSDSSDTDDFMKHFYLPRRITYAHFSSSSSSNDSPM